MVTKNLKHVRTKQAGRSSKSLKSEAGRRVRTFGKHKIHDVAWQLFRYGVIAQREPTTGYWMAWAGPNDGKYTIIKYDVDASFDSKKQALDALMDVIRADCAESIGVER